MTALLLVASLFLCAGVSDAPVGDERILYLVSQKTATHADASEKAPEGAKLKAFDIVTGREAAPGWLQIELSTGSADAEGRWIPIEPDNVVSGTMEALKYRVSKAQQTKWSERVRLDVARGRIRRGFTADQVRLALGDPRSKELRHGPDVIAEEWTYDDVQVVVSTSGVTEIRPFAKTR